MSETDQEAAPPERPLLRALITFLKYAIVIGALAYLVGSGKLSVSRFRFGAESILPQAFGLVCLLAVVVLMGIRYWLLLTGIGIALGPFQVVRIVFIGMFFNTFMLGGAGGDVVKLGYVLQETDERSRAVASVLVDRAIGLTGLLSIAFLALVFSWEEVVRVEDLHGVILVVLGLWGAAGYSSLVGLVALTKGRRWGLVVWAGVLAVISALAALTFPDLAGAARADPGLRTQALLVLAGVALTAFLFALLLPSCLPGRTLDRTLQRLPLGGLVASLIQAVLVYKDRLGALAQAYGLSLVSQSLVLLALFQFSRSLPLDPQPALQHVLFAAPPAFIANLVPVPGGGLGVGEAAFEKVLSLCRSPGGAPVLGGAEVFLLNRFWLVVVGLVGLPLYLRRGAPPPPSGEATEQADGNEL